MATFEKKTKSKESQDNMIKAQEVLDHARKKIRKARFITDHFSEKMKKQGYISEILIVDPLPTYLAEGWYTFLVASDHSHNVFQAVAKKGCALDVHVHENEDEVLTITEGKLKRIGPIVNTADKRGIISGKDGPVYIPAEEPHGFEALEDTKMVVIFRPPIRVVKRKNE